MAEGQNFEHSIDLEKNLEAEKEKLFAEIEAAIFEDTYSEESRFALIRVLGHSLSDGIELGRRIRESEPEELLWINRDRTYPENERVLWLIERHQSFFKSVYSRSSLWGDERFNEAFPIFYLGKNTRTPHNGTILLPPQTDLEKKIDDYYTKIFPHRLEEKHTREDVSVPKKRGKNIPRTSAFEKAEATMERSKFFLSPHYYTGDFLKEILAPALKDHMDDGEDIRHFIDRFSGEYEKYTLLYTSHISEADAQRCLDFFEIELTEERKKLMKKMKYHPDIVDSRMIEIAKRDLREDIELGISAGYVVKKDSEGEWRMILDEKEKSETEQGDSSLEGQGEYVPNQFEQDRLELLNAFENKDNAVRYINNHLSQHPKITLKQKVRRFLGGRGAKRTLELSAKKNPEDFFPRMSVNFEQGKDEYRKAENFLEVFFPSLYNSWKREHRTGAKITNIAGYLDPNNRESPLVDGDPEQKDPKVIFTSRRKISGFYPTRFLGRFNSYTQSLREVDMQFGTQKRYGGTQETYTLPVPEGLQDVILPVSHVGELLLERVVGIKVRPGGAREEIALTPSQNAQGIWRVTIPHEVTEIIYSELHSSLERQEGELSLLETKDYKEKVIAETEEDLLEDIFDTIPLSWQEFLKNLERKSRKEQIGAIQEFVLSISYYDFKNEEVMGQKGDLSPSERVAFMKERLRTLEQREKNSTTKTKLQKKQLAGVCEDFALINMGLLRRLGIPAGLVSGLLVKDSDTITTRDSHRLVFVPVPTKQSGGFVPYLIEATPEGLTEEENEQLQKITWTGDEKRNEKKQEELKKLEEQLALLQKIYEEENVLDILNLQNGKLEDVLNTILSVGVKEHHTKMFESIFSFARYGGVDRGNSQMLSDVAQQLIEEQRAQKKGEKNDNSGTNLMHLFQEYIFRYIRDGEKRGESKAKAKENAFGALQHIIEAVSPHLEQIEKMAALVILADLRAQGMSSFARPQGK